MLDLNTLETWRKVALELSALKEREMTLRKAIFAETFKDPHEGINLCDVQNGWKLSATLPYSRTLDQSKAEQVFKDLKKQKLAHLIRVKYELSVGDYKKLQDDDVTKAIIDSILTTKPGAPTLALVPPKG